MKFIKLILLSVILIFSAAGTYFAQNKDEVPEVDTFIARQEKKENVKEYKYARELTRGDLDGDGREDLAVLYTLDGYPTGLGFIRYLAVFTGSGKSFSAIDSLAVSGIIDRQINLNLIEKGEIVIKTLEYYRSGQTHYRIVGKKRFKLVAGRLKEIKNYD